MRREVPSDFIELAVGCAADTIRVRISFVIIARIEVLKNLIPDGALDYLNAIPGELEELFLAHPVNNAAHLGSRLLCDQASIGTDLVEPVDVGLTNIGHRPEIKISPKKRLLGRLKSADNP